MRPETLRGIFDFLKEKGERMPVFAMPEDVDEHYRMGVGQGLQIAIDLLSPLVEETNDEK